jgi:GDPmannose 4,6-dehydratase
MRPSRQKTALITGIMGQDGYYLSRLLLDKGYVVHGIVRRSSSMARSRLDQLKDEFPRYDEQLHLHYGDVTDGAGTIERIMELKPDEVYNLAAQSHVRVSFDKPIFTHQVNALGALHVLEGARLLNRSKPVRVYQASTSEMFGGLPGSAPQSERTPFHPRSPYACAKVAAFHHTVNYRESYGLFACNGILFNHESPFRGENFVTRKITLAAARIRCGLQERLSLGNLDAQRDWGFAGDFVDAMWRMLQQDAPGDYVIATGETHTVQEFIEAAFARVGLDWESHVDIDPRFFRPSEVDILCGDSSKARAQLQWQPATTFTHLVQMMVDHDLRLAERERRIKLLEDEQAGLLQVGAPPCAA